MNNRKIYINPRQYGVIKESEWGFHVGANHDMRPYGSDNKYMMSGRETGHFGSGTYFSTYKDKKDINQYGDESNNFNPNFIEISNHIYRVDFDLYKNLYRVRSKKQGDVLYTMLADLNHMYGRITVGGHFNKSSARYNNSDLYQRIKANADGLGLKCPSYYELTRMAERHNGVQSFSTLFMEYNGYNGVNVSGVGYYDNTKHGSVIYDLSKVNTEMEEIKPKSLFSGFKDSYYNDTVVQDIDDPRMEALKGKESLWVYHLNDMSTTEAMRVLKNYTDSGNILNAYMIDEYMNDDLAKRYLRLLFARNPRDYWGNKLCNAFVSGNSSRSFIKLIEKHDAYYWINYESEDGSILVNLLNRFGMDLDWGLSVEEENSEKKRYLEKLMTYLKRDLTPYEKDFIKEDYYNENQ